MSVGAFLLSKLDVLGNRAQEATLALVGKGLSSITTYQAQFVEQVLEYLKRHQTRTQRDLALEIVRSLAESSDPPFYYIDRGTEARITVNALIDISTVANIKVYWNKDGTEIASTSTATPGNVYSAEVQIQDFPLYHGNFYKLDVLYENGTDRYPITSFYVVVRASQSADSAILGAPTLVSAITDGGGEFTTITWTNPTHKDFRFAQIRTSDGLILYRGNGTTYIWYHDKSGSERLRLYSEGPGGHTVGNQDTIPLSALTISTNVTTGGTNLQTLAVNEAAGIAVKRDIRALEGEPLQEAWVFGEADVRVGTDDIGDALSISAGEWVIDTANYANVNAYGFKFRFEVDDCDGNCVYSSEEHMTSFGHVVMLLIPANDLADAFVPGTSYTYRIMVTDTLMITQQVMTGCFLVVPCPEEIEDVGPNDHYVLTEASTSTLQETTSTSDCGCQ